MSDQPGGHGHLCLGWLRPRYSVVSEAPDDAIQHRALLDGVHASFLLSARSDEDLAAAADWAWSAGVRHHVLIRSKQIVVTRASGSTETLERKSVEADSPSFFGIWRSILILNELSVRSTIS